MSYPDRPPQQRSRWIGLLLSLAQPSSLAALASVSLHGVSWQVAPLLPLAPPEPIQAKAVGVVQLTGGERSRLPAFAQPAPPVALNQVPPSDSGLPNIPLSETGELPTPPPDEALADATVETGNTSGDPTAAGDLFIPLGEEVTPQAELEIPPPPLDIPSDPNPYGANSFDETNPPDPFVPPSEGILSPPDVPPPPDDTSDILNRLLQELGKKPPESAPQFPPEALSPPNPPQDEKVGNQSESSSPSSESAPQGELPNPSPLPGSLPSEELSFAGKDIEVNDLLNLAAQHEELIVKVEEALPKTPEGEIDEEQISFDWERTVKDFYPSDACSAAPPPSGETLIGVAVRPDGTRITDPTVLLSSSSAALDQAAETHAANQDYGTAPKFQLIAIRYEFTGETGCSVPDSSSSESSEGSPNRSSGGPEGSSDQGKRI